MTPAALDDKSFAAKMDLLGPFETAPEIAVAVSGGADSLAAALLADRWVRERGGQIHALTVDHRLRPESGIEAARVARWLGALDIRHAILPWHESKPATGLQAAARRARYTLIEDWCRQRGILHVLLAHHLEDQAETLLQRLGRGSGTDGLSAMAAITETPHVRLLRPLLDVPKAALRATLTARGQDWIEDPSNANTAFQRVRLRRLMPALAGEGMTSARLAATAGRMGRARVALEQDTARFIARGVMLDPSGWARFDLAALLALPMDIGLRALASLTRTVGGGTYPPRLERLERVLGELRAAPPKRRTFQGCLLLVQADQSVMVCREPAAAAPAQAVSAGQTVYWDRRFTIRLGGAGTAKLGALGTTGYASLDRAARRSRLPRAVIATVPALSDETGVCQVPHLGYHGGRRGGVTIEQVKFVPDHPLSSP